MMKKIIYKLALYSLTIFSLCLTKQVFAETTPKAPRSPPNIVFINVDDLGWGDIEYNDHSKVFNTPNINQLAKKSVHFTNAYAGAANCAPSRAVLMSGQYTPRHGMYTVSSSARGNKVTRKLIPIKNTEILANDVITMAEMFQRNGYKTATFGKWHLGEDPTTQGFELNVAGNLKGHPKSYFSPYNLPFLQNGPEGEYLTDRLTSEAISWMKSVKSQTFFLYLPYFTVHTPLQAVEKVKQKYLTHPNVNNDKHASYAAMVESMDKNVGRLLNAIKQENLTDNTLIVFTSDNGGIRAISSQAPLRAGKGSYYEGGTRVPLLISWPGKIAAKRVDTPVINADFYPSFMKIINAAPIKQTLDGADISPLLFSAYSTAENTLRERALFWHFPIYLQAYNAAGDQSRDPLFRTRPGASMRKGRWKLHHYFEDNQYELYDLTNDLSEQVNLAQYRPEVVNRLARELKHWQQGIHAPIPTQKNPYFDAIKTAKFTKQQLIKKQGK